MRSTTRTAIAATAIASAAGLGLVPAQAAETAESSRITVRASDYEVKPGEQFILRGRMVSQGVSVDDATVRVQAYRNGGWEPLRGAVVRTGEDGRYRVRVVLQSGGDRDLRVVGNPADEGIRLARAYTVVRVLG